MFLNAPLKSVLVLNSITHQTLNMFIIPSCSAYAKKNKKYSVKTRTCDYSNAGPASNPFGHDACR